MTRYNSKIDWWLVAIICVVLIAASMSMVSGGSWVGFVINILVFAFVAHLFTTTYYTINGDDLNIRSGFIYNKTFAIHGITEISETNNPLSSPATSLDRLEIRTGEGGSVMISPKEKDKFLTHICAINPRIKVFRK